MPPPRQSTGQCAPVGRDDSVTTCLSCQDQVCLQSLEIYPTAPAFTRTNGILPTLKQSHHSRYWSVCSLLCVNPDPMTLHPETFQLLRRAEKETKLTFSSIIWVLLLPKVIDICFFRFRLVRTDYQPAKRAPCCCWMSTPASSLRLTHSGSPPSRVKPPTINATRFAT